MPSDSGAHQGEAHALTSAELALRLRYGWDLELDDRYLYTPDGETTPVALLRINVPKRDNRQLVVGEMLRQVGVRGRSIVWLTTRHGDVAADTFLQTNGFTRSSRDARRLQVLGDVDPGRVPELGAGALERCAEYRAV